VRIKTQFIITLTVFSLLLIVITSSIVVTSQQVAKTREQESLAYSIVQGSSDLTYLSNDYVIYRGSQQLSQWQSRYGSFSQDVGNLNVETAEQKALVVKIQANQQRMKTTFDGIVLALGTSQNQSSTPNQTLSAIQVSWSRISIQTQSVASDGTRLAQLLRGQVDQLNTFNFILILAIVGTFIAFLGVIYVQTFRRTLKSISDLRTGAAVIGSGNLDYKLEESAKDEIGELSQTFNQMTTNLKMVTASKSDLEREMAQRKKVEEALRESEHKLEEYSKNLEKLVEERTKQLKDSERLAAIGATAGMVGHDIRNPLQAITGDVYLAKSDLASMADCEGKQCVLESLTEVEKNIDYINKIVADLQDFARPLKPNVEETDLKSIIDDLLKKNGLPENVEVSVKVETGKIVVDSTFINRILYNLVNNAVQAMPKGGKLTIRTYKEANDTLISVKDTGVGIPEIVKGKLFTPMFTTKSKGQGFGLAVIKRMTEALGGTVTFESQEGKGTKFIVRLPPPQELNGKWTYK
jgi:signal transduction histidine kinase